MFRLDALVLLSMRQRPEQALHRASDRNTVKISEDMQLADYYQMEIQSLFQGSWCNSLLSHHFFVINIIACHYINTFYYCVQWFLLYCSLQERIVSYYTCVAKVVLV